MRPRPRNILLSATIALMTAVALPCAAAGHIDASTLVSTPHGTFNEVAYTRYEAMFEGVTATHRPYRVPCQIIAPSVSGTGSGLLLFDWLVVSTIPTAVGQEQADARYSMGDAFLFGMGAAYATVRCQQEAIGTESPTVNPTRPWSDDLLDTSSEFISSAGDEFDIVVDYVNALASDAVALNLLGTMDRTAAFGYSASGYRLRGLMRLKMGEGLFDFALVGGTGNGYDQPSGNKIGFSKSEKPPLAGNGLEIDLQSETDALILGAYKTRHEESNYRAYQFAGASHLRRVDAVEFGLVDSESANPADWTPFFRALFVAADRWVDGISPPPSIWLGAPNDASIARDSNGNALVRYVGRQPVSTTGYRLPEVAVGQNQYIGFDLSYDDGSFLGYLRELAGSHVDLTGNFTSHSAYVADVESRARALQADGYLLGADADAIILTAQASHVGVP